MKRRIIALGLLLMLLITCVACGEGEPPAEENNGYAPFAQGTVTIAIDADAAPILAALGEWRDYNESASCAFEGLDKVYTYAGFEIQTYPMDGKDYVYMVLLYDDTVSTPEGVRVGQSAKDVTNAYGTPTEQTANAMIYRGKGSCLEFLFRDGAVTNVKYCKESAK